VHYQSCVHTSPCVGHPTPFKLQSQEGLLTCTQRAPSKARVLQHHQGCNPHLHVIPDRSCLDSTLLCLSVNSCSAMADSRPGQHGKDLQSGRSTCTLFIRHYSGSPCWFLFSLPTGMLKFGRSLCTPSGWGLQSIILAGSQLSGNTRRALPVEMAQSSHCHWLKGRLTIAISDNSEAHTATQGIVCWQ